MGTTKKHQKGRRAIKLGDKNRETKKRMLLSSNMEPNEARKTSDVPENKPWIRNQWFQEKEMQEMGGWQGKSRGRLQGVGGVWRGGGGEFK